jgi:hypothetical protein
MALLNYTTSIAPEKTLKEIERALVAHGAKGVMTAYGADKQPESLAFIVPTAYGDRSFRLPANVAGVEAVLKAQHRKGKVEKRFATREQAARVAWRITKDWVEAQLAIVEAGMVTIDEVMFPYMLDGQDRTVFQVFRDKQLALPGR